MNRTFSTSLTWWWKHSIWVTYFENITLVTFSTLVSIVYFVVSWHPELHLLLFLTYSLLLSQLCLLLLFMTAPSLQLLLFFFLKTRLRRHLDGWWSALFLGNSFVSLIVIANDKCRTRSLVPSIHSVSVSLICLKLLWSIYGEWCHCPSPITVIVAFSGLGLS